MPLSRLLILIVGLILILGLSIWLVDSLTRLYWQLAYYPLLSQALLFLIIVLIGVLIAAFFTTSFGYRKGKSKSKSEIADRNPKYPLPKPKQPRKHSKPFGSRLHKFKMKLHGKSF